MTSRIFTKIPNFEKLKPTRDFFPELNFIALVPLNDADHDGEIRFSIFKPVSEISSWKDFELAKSVCTIFLNLFSLSILLPRHILYQFLCIFACSTQRNHPRVSRTIRSPPRGEKGVIFLTPPTFFWLGLAKNRLQIWTLRHESHLKKYVRIPLFSILSGVKFI